MTLNTLLRDQPTNAATHHRFALACAERGDFDAAIVRILRAVMLDCVPALGSANLGMLHDAMDLPQYIPTQE